MPHGLLLTSSNYRSALITRSLSTFLVVLSILFSNILGSGTADPWGGGTTEEKRQGNVPDENPVDGL
jgi:hypothetical protein